jgi:hypothetical protein
MTDWRLVAVFLNQLAESIENNWPQEWSNFLASSLDNALKDGVE